MTARASRTTHPSLEESQSNLANLFSMSRDKQPKVQPPPLYGMYEIECVLQKAIFGEVLLVKSLKTGKLFVLKAAEKHLLEQRCAADGCAVFEDYQQELVILDESRGKSHANLLAAAPRENQVPDLSETTCYTCLPFLEGGELFAKVEEIGAFGDTVRAKQLSRGIAEGLSHLHNVLGYAHNDISLENVLLAADGSPVICDFGLALRIGEAWNPMRRFSGKLQYQAPEIYQGTVKQVSAAADVYSLGVTIFVLITGIPPFERPDEVRDMRFSYVQQGRMADLLQLWQQDISISAVELLTGMLAADPSKRLTMAQVLDHPWMVSSSIDYAQEEQNASHPMGICAGQTLQSESRAHKSSGKCLVTNHSSSPCSVFSFDDAYRKHKGVQDEKSGHKVVQHLEVDAVTSDFMFTIEV